MERSESIANLAAALTKAQAEFSAIPKSETNPHFNSKYADLATVKAHTDPVLTKYGLAVTQLPGHEELTTMLLHESGEFICETMNLYVSKTRNDRERGVVIIPPDPQSQGSALTYARRYAYMAICGVVADEDDDGNKAADHIKRPVASGVDDLLGGAPAPAAAPVKAESAPKAVEPTDPQNNAAANAKAAKNDGEAELRGLISEHSKILSGFYPEVWATVETWAKERNIDLENIPKGKLRAVERSLRGKLDQLAPLVPADPDATV